MQRRPPSSQTEQKHGAEAERHLHKHFHYTRCLRLCVLSEDTATFVFFYQTSNTHTRAQILVFTWEHGFSSWHMYMQSVSLTCAGKLREKGGRGRREGEKIDMDVNGQTHKQTGSRTLWSV